MEGAAIQGCHGVRVLGKCRCKDGGHSSPTSEERTVVHCATTNAMREVRAHRPLKREPS